MEWLANWGIHALPKSHLSGFKNIVLAQESTALSFFGSVDFDFLSHHLDNNKTIQISPFLKHQYKDLWSVVYSWLWQKISTLKCFLMRVLLAKIIKLLLTEKQLSLPDWSTRAIWHIWIPKNSYDYIIVYFYYKLIVRGLLCADSCSVYLLAIIRHGVCFL